MQPTPEEPSSDVGDANYQRHPDTHARDFHGDVPVHIETDRNEAHVYFSDYELLHMHYHHMHGHGRVEDEPLDAVSDVPQDTLSSSDPEVDTMGGNHQDRPEPGEEPPIESLRIHRMRHRSHAEPAPEVDPSEYEETVS